MNGTHTMPDDPADTAELPPKPPGSTPVGEVNYEVPNVPADVLATGERLALAQTPAGPPPLPEAWQLLADWSSEPTPAFAGAANTIHFYLNHRDGIGYQGYLFFKAASPPYHPFVNRNTFYGTGHVYPNVPWGELYKASGPAGMPAPWVRLVISLRATGGLAGLTFHEPGGSAALPGAQVGWAEEDVRDLLGAPPHFVTGFGGWVLYLELTTLLM